MQSILEEDTRSIVRRIAPAAEDLAGKTVLIIGGLGFLGRNFRAVFDILNAEVLSTPCKVLVVDSLITSTNKTGSGGRDEDDVFLHHDIREPLRVDEKLDFIIHCAGVASPFYYRRFPVETIEVATLGTKHILELARRDGAKVLFFSSSEIYGDPTQEHLPTKEEYKGNVACIGPRACYDESKRLGETMCYIYSEYFDTHTTIVRPFNVYGPGMRETDYRVLPNFASAIKAGRPLPIYASGKQTRTYCYLADAMVGFMLALLRGRRGEPYNIGNPTPEISVSELADLIAEVTGLDFQRVRQDYPDSYPADEPQRRCPDISKAREHLGYEPEVTIETGLKRFFDWTQANFEGVELE
jgi:UDP-glucuronate decarboxylase